MVYWTNPKMTSVASLYVVMNEFEKAAQLIGWYDPEAPGCSLSN